MIEVSDLVDVSVPVLVLLAHRALLLRPPGRRLLRR
jgi:hypothetical protein